MDVVLDLGRPPVLHERQQRRVLREAKVTGAELLAICEHPEVSDWTSDNRAGVSGTLPPGLSGLDFGGWPGFWVVEGCLRHRISRHMDGKLVAGLTIRMACAQRCIEHVEALRGALRDKRSLLVLGPPGGGKTTLLRELAQAHDELGRRVVVVDTSCEIAGCGAQVSRMLCARFGPVPHDAVGCTTRRRKVADRSKQHKESCKGQGVEGLKKRQDMLEAVLNDTPEILAARLQGEGCLLKAFGGVNWALEGSTLSPARFSVSRSAFPGGH